MVADGRKRTGVPVECVLCGGVVPFRRGGGSLVVTTRGSASGWRGPYFVASDRALVSCLATASNDYGLNASACASACYFGFSHPSRALHCRRKRRAELSRRARGWRPRACKHVCDRIRRRSPSARRRSGFDCALGADRSSSMGALAGVEKSMVTMESVAAAAGVSTSTVSHVINGTRKVHPDTQKAVLDAIERVGYSPNHLARALAGAPTRTVGLAISALSNHYFGELVHAIEAECAKCGLMMLLADTHEDPEYEVKVVQALHERRVDGILIAPAASSEQRALGYLRERNVPTVLVDRFVGTSFDQIGVESRDAAKALVSHLIALGHRRIAFVSGTEGLSTTTERLEGYQLALQAAGIKFNPAWVRSGESKIEPAFEAVRLLLSQERRPSAIMTSNNLMTIGAMRALRAAGLSVPLDVSLVGFDDFDWADVFAPRLTVIAQPVEELGTKAVRLLARRIANPGARRQTIRLAPALRLRDSAVAVRPRAR